MAEKLADHTTLRVGGPARTFLTPTSERDLIGWVQDADTRGEPVLILGGGSNLVVSDAGFAGTVIRTAWLRGVKVVDQPDRVSVEVAVGEPWDAFVARAVSEGWVGIEALSGIPGTVGSTPIQNVGAYGQEVRQTITEVRVWDRVESAVKTLTGAECRFGYRWSVFKAHPGRWVVLGVSFRFEVGEWSAPIRYGELARDLGVQIGERAPLAAVREAVLRLRRAKGMVLDAADHDTWSAGSFFTNPVVSPQLAQTLPADAPRYPQPNQQVKLSAAWLIDHAGFAKGYGNGPARVSTKHTLALTNRGAAGAGDIIALAREIRAGVEECYGVRLVPEPVLIGVSLDP